MAVVPIGLGIAHQVMAAIVLGAGRQRSPGASARI